MCGIVALVGPDKLVDTLVAGLERLEYRGYDSAGIAVTGQGSGMQFAKEAGRLSRLVTSLPHGFGAGMSAGIGHTRWATHGTANRENAHPHFDCFERIAVVHNGIIDNVEPLKEELIAAGHAFGTPVDTEVVAHLIEDALSKSGSLTAAVASATQRLSGSWALAVTTAGSCSVVLARRGSPLLVAETAEGGFAAA
jgi:glutamine---fructose-6-phosphate transaminase (isomerizing)